MPARTKAFIVTLIFSALYLALAVSWQLKFSALLVLLTAAAYLVIEAGRQRERAQVLEQAYRGLDEQAKLIVQTDFQLQTAQDELDKKLSGLYTLHLLGQQLQVTVNREQVFGLVTPTFVGKLGFERCLIGLLDAGRKHLTWQTHIGCTPLEARQLLAHLEDLKLPDLLAKRSQPWMINQGQEQNDLERRLLQIFTLGTCAIAPLLVKGNLQGFLLLGNETISTKVTAGDVELISVMAQQVSVAMENAQLYEELFQSRRELETKIQERTRELAAANAELQRLNKAKSDFVSMVAHELRTPLTSVKGYASILRTGQLGPVSEPQAERLLRIEKQADRLAGLINNLLDIARIESGRVAMSPMPLSVDSLMSRLQDLFRPQYSDKQVELVIATNGVKELVADPGQIERVFINLLSNALKYTPPQGQVTVTLQPRPGEILAEVRDTGVGISADNIPQLFQEFYRAPNPINDRVQGTGLGLSLTRRIVEAHRGRIWVESDVGHGTRMLFTLPTSVDALQLAPPAAA